MLKFISVLITPPPPLKIVVNDLSFHFPFALLNNHVQWIIMYTILLIQLLTYKSFISVHCKSINKNCLHGAYCLVLIKGFLHELFPNLWPKDMLIHYLSIMLFDDCIICSQVSIKSLDRLQILMGFSVELKLHQGNGITKRKKKYFLWSFIYTINYKQNWSCAWKMWIEMVHFLAIIFFTLNKLSSINNVSGR